MKKTTTQLLLLLLSCGFGFNSIAQNQDPGKQSTSASSSTNIEESLNWHKKGTFFIAPFYEYTQFDKLELISHTNYYTVWEGENSYTYTDDDINAYNDNYGTEYRNSMSGVKFGYNVMNGLGVSAYVGIDHYNFKSWISTENTQSYSADYPALTLGLTADYLKSLNDHLTAVSAVSYNFTSSKSVKVENTSGTAVASSSIKTMYWDINLALAYRIHRFLPFAGAGFTQQFVHPVTTEQQLTEDENGNDFYEKTRFDSHYRGSSVYGFAGLEFIISEKLSVYARSSFLNPVRANAGLRISL